MKQAECLQISAVQASGREAVTIEFEVDAEHRRRFGFVAGQYVTLAPPSDGVADWRCYSITSPPAELDARGRLRVLVRRVRGGRVSNWLCDHARPGIGLRVLPPAGQFTLRRPTGDLRLFAGGSGIAPILALARAALEVRGSNVALFYANRDRASAMVIDELRALESEHHAHLTVEYLYDDEHGLPSPPRMKVFIQRHAAQDDYLCGPEPFMRFAAQALAECGVAADRVHRESFDAGLESDAAPAGGAECSLWVAVTGQDPKPVAVLPGESLLAAILRAGLAAPHACKVGECASCMCRLEQGEVHRLPNAVLDDDDIAAGWLLACRTLPASPELRVRFP